MLLQAAKIIGSGLATIGLTNILLSPLQSNNLLTKLYLTLLSTEGIKTVDNMIKSLDLNQRIFNEYLFIVL